MDTTSGGRPARVDPLLVGTDDAAPYRNGLPSRLNWLRAGVLGANDGIISIAGLVVGVAAATSDSSAILTAGVAGLVAGAVSMALGEYVSVSSQRDTERAVIDAERRAHREDPQGELAELAEIFRSKGLSAGTAHQVATELHARDAFAAHIDVEHGLDPDRLTNPWHAALASAVAFVLGAALPLVAVVTAPPATRIPVTFVAVMVALALTGSISARLGHARRMRAVVRLLAGGALAMAVTWAIGALLGVAVG
ncbi:VIT family protein [Actinotalea sp. K2]|uniref:VIT1/CCC1 transporter family protein n=1 Tax=Actinotalea sp. K2 TaxID=2939438 RepID=UPI0020183A91|nr:VIT family protein [Actinotalea sp. K2]MCL3862928.1 VIT family protein [Actinotalea sp. K2]